MRSNTGKVIIAAAGPGDPGLITVKAAIALQEADVILTDRLASREIISAYAKPNARVIEVGKQGGKLNSTPQKTINECLVEFALQGKKIVRLKGGDVSVYSNILDELLTLHQHGIAFEIIPGVTAALGAAAYAGIPLTARGYSTGLRILTYYHSEVITNKEWKDIAQTTDTLVFYMSAQSLNDLSSNLLRFGMDPEMPIAVIEQATTTAQNVFVIDLKSAVDIPVDNIQTPALIIIGRVASLYPRFKWFEPNQSLANAFSEVPHQTIPPTVQRTVI
jgi:uroporphyrin-III C-methyltransferase